MIKRQKKRRKSSRLGRSLLRIFKLLLLFLLLAAAFDFAQNGNLDHTIRAVSEIPGNFRNIPETFRNLPETFRKLPEKGQELFEEGKHFVLRLLGKEETEVWSLDDIPEYSGSPYVELNGNKPSFTPEEMKQEPFASYSSLDLLGRVGVADAMLDRSLMPTEERGEIDMVRPSGWHGVWYDSIEDGFLYNRCHLIGFQLTGENANEENLFTGTRYLNVEGMLPWENQVASHIRMTGDRVRYRVTPVFEGGNLLASGVQIEARSVRSDRICFNVFIYNVQPGIGIDYEDGDSWERLLE